MGLVRQSHTWRLSLKAGYPWNTSSTLLPFKTLHCNAFWTRLMNLFHASSVVQGNVSAPLFSHQIKETFGKYRTSVRFYFCRFASGPSLPLMITRLTIFLCLIRPRNGTPTYHTTLQIATFWVSRWGASWPKERETLSLCFFFCTPSPQEKGRGEVRKGILPNCSNLR